MAQSWKQSVVVGLAVAVAVGAFSLNRIQPTFAAEQLASGAHLEGNGSWNVVMARNQAPKLAADHQRGDQRCADSHIFEVLDMDRRHAAQPA